MTEVTAQAIETGAIPNGPVPYADQLALYDPSDPAHNVVPDALPSAIYPVAASQADAAGNEPMRSSMQTEAEVLLKVEQRVAEELKQLAWWKQPFREQIAPFIRANVKRELAEVSAGSLAGGGLAAAAAAAVNEAAGSGEAAARRRLEAQNPALRESAGARDAAKAVLHEYVKKGTAVTSLAAAGLMFIPVVGQIAGGALIAAHGAVNVRTSVHDAGIRAKEHVAQAHIRLQATGSAGEDMSAGARIKQNIARVQELPAGTVKEIGAKALAYAGAVLSPLGQEHQVARAGAKGFSRLLSPDAMLSMSEGVLSRADPAELLEVSQRIQQSIDRGFIRNTRSVPKLLSYKESVDKQLAGIAGPADTAQLREFGRIRREQAAAVAADIDARALADEKWAAKHAVAQKSPTGAGCRQFGA